MVFKMNLNLKKNVITGIKIFVSQIATTIVLLPVLIILALLSFGIDVIAGIFFLISYFPIKLYADGRVFNWINKRF